MYRNYEPNTTFPQATLYQTRLRTAIHEAGHAAAIYLGNKQKQLQPVFFQIVITKIPNKAFAKTGHYLAKVQGGRLIDCFSCCMQTATRDFSPAQKKSYLQAFDADVVNFMVGPLAEAHYVAFMDNEPINAHLVNFPALRFYGGASDLDAIEEYLDFYTDDATRRRQKINQLMAEAFNFINHREHWRAIIALSQTLMTNKSGRVSYQEIATVLDQHSPSLAKKA